MVSKLEQSIVRIRSSKDSQFIVGAGFQIEERWILTCAHVIAHAIGAAKGIKEIPTAEVFLDFPLVEPGHILKSHLIYCNLKRDIAGLELDDSLPNNTQSVELMPAGDLWNHTFRAFGYPAGLSDGIWASGVMRGKVASGWIHIEDIKEPGHRVEQGFSGSPVWDDQLKAVIGMVVAEESQPQIKAAFIIPAAMLIESWPILKNNFPQIISTSPENGSVDVPCDLESFEIVFSKPMASSRSITSNSFPWGDVIHENGSNTFIFKREKKSVASAKY